MKRKSERIGNDELKQKPFLHIIKYVREVFIMLKFKKYSIVFLMNVNFIDTLTQEKELQYQTLLKIHILI